MTFEEYKAQVYGDAVTFIDDNYRNYFDFQELYDDMYIDDSVTGNGSGSYTFNGYAAEENVKDLLFDDAFACAARDNGYQTSDIFGVESGETIDVMARCFALSEISWQLEGHYNNELSEDN